MLKYWAVLGPGPAIRSKSAHQDLWKSVEEAANNGQLPDMDELDRDVPSGWARIFAESAGSAAAVDADPGASASGPPAGGEVAEAAPKRRRRLKLTSSAG